MSQDKFDKLSDTRKELVSYILSDLERDINPWIKPWTSNFAPRNAVTDKEYRGVNNAYLTFLSLYKGIKDPRWATFNQIKKKGWHLQAGSKGAKIEVVKFHDKLTKKDLDWNEFNKLDLVEQKKYWDENVRFVLQHFTVFNASNIDGIEPYVPTEIDIKDTYIRAQNIIKNSEAKIFHDGGDRAYYRPTNDTIHLPEKAWFNSTEDYYGTAFHEIGHSTGHTTRLARDMSGMFLSKAYAKEELVAEICSMFLQQDTQISLDKKHLENHSAYLKSWSESIKDDPNYLFDAIGKANKAADYVLGLENKSVYKNNIDSTIKRMEANQSKDKMLNISHDTMAHEKISNKATRNNKNYME